MLGMGLFAYLFVFTITTICAWRMMTRLGFPGWYALIAYIPVLNFIALWALAFVPWPKTDNKELKEFFEEVKTELPHMQQKFKRVINSFKNK